MQRIDTVLQVASLGLKLLQTVLARQAAELERDARALARAAERAEKRLGRKAGRALREASEEAEDTQGQVSRAAAHLAEAGAEMVEAGQERVAEAGSKVAEAGQAARKAAAHRLADVEHRVAAAGHAVEKQLRQRTAQASQALARQRGRFEGRRAALARRIEPRRRTSLLGTALKVALGAAAAGGATYLVVREQRRVRERYRPLRATFATDLLDVLSAPGGGGRLTYSGSQLLDVASGAVYAIIDGIPDFIAPAALAAEPEQGESLLADLARPYLMRFLGRNSAGNAAFASAVAGAADGGWALSVPSGRGTYELEMAHANPGTRVLCVSNDWDTLLEVRRRAQAAGLTNLYYARGLPRLLPLRDAGVNGVWTAGGLDRFPQPERELTQMARVARPGALMAGVSLVLGAPPHLDWVLQMGQSRLRGMRPLTAHFALLQAAGLSDVRVFRDGAFVRFTGVRR
jgi:SAM-dependent methyltransferase